MSKCTCLGRAVLTGVSTDFFQLQPADLSCFLLSPPSPFSSTYRSQEPLTVEMGAQVRTAACHVDKLMMVPHLHLPKNRGRQRRSTIPTRHRSPETPSHLTKVTQCRCPLFPGIPLSRRFRPILFALLHVYFCSSVGTPGP